MNWMQEKPSSTTKTKKSQKWMKVHDQDLDTRGLLRFLQEESQKWREHSFPPEHRTAPLQALGVAEEAGELAHAVLKREQDIRGPESVHLSKAADAVGDIIIYLAGLCSNLGLDLESCVKLAWTEVASRDWSQYKETGVENDEYREKTIKPLYQRTPHFRMPSAEATMPGGAASDEDHRERTCPDCGGNGCEYCAHTGAIALRETQPEGE